MVWIKMDGFGQLAGGFGLTSLLFAYVARQGIELSFRLNQQRAKAQLEKMTEKVLEQGRELDAAHQAQAGGKDRLRQLERAAKQRQQAIAELRKAGDCLVHVLGERGGPNRLFCGDLTFTARQRGKHPRGILADPRIWRFPNMVEVWAEEEGEALRLMQSTFPKSEGFRLSRFRELLEDGSVLEQGAISGGEATDPVSPS